ncbi:Glutaredoxin-like domain [Gracilibacillus ureilyticus]|uniref:Glutaredoxin-like domain n=1 Tax=Gracilibacillus ureilyticus TaxID=531814 RepID=A0A1H9S5Q6_9BACI|nr:glutaredoxin family protein [Gracilibacillus ureilyticus]SER80362.1 Glutaredoxin-like domain [Gracilibacillus ureilyticus]
MLVKLYGKENCSLCMDAKIILDLLQSVYPLEIDEIDIYQDEALLEKYHLIIPVVEMDNEIIDSGIVSYEKLDNYLKNKKSV